MTDIEQANEIKSGNIKVFENLFRTMYPALCGYGLKMLHNRELAEEMVQEVFYQLWKNHQTLEITGSLNAYLYKAVYNRCLRQIEHQQVVDKYAAHQMTVSSATYSVNDAMQTGEIYAIYKKTLLSLPARCRKIFQMNRNYGFKYYEIADKLSISVKTVEADMGKALKAFRKSFAGYHVTE